MAEYIEPPITTEPDDLAEDAFAYLEDAIPGWLPAPGNLETWLVEANAQLAGELMDVASAVPTSIFRYYGETVLGLPPNEAQSATGTTTWTARDAAGYTIEAGTLIGIAAAGDELLPFEVQSETVIAPGATTATGVIVVAVDPGTEANGLTSAPEVIDPLDWVASLALAGATAGGVDEETDADYLDRLHELLGLLAPRPILPNDFAVLARTVAGVGRSTAIDLYNPGPPVATNVPRCVTVVVAGDDGQPVGAGVKANVDTLLQSLREVNFLVYVIDPTYTAIAVTFTFTTYPAYSAATVEAAAEAAVANYLSPANFGRPPYGDDPGVWIADTKVRYLEVAEVINRVEGVWYVASLTVNGGTADVALSGPGPLPTPGAINGTPVAPS
jgi:uncharacterized phage protein gp47/JayE